MRTRVDRDETPTPLLADPFDAGPFSRWLEPRAGPRFPAREARRHAALAALLAWLPLVLLSAMADSAPRTMALGSLRLEGITARYLVAIPLLIVGLRLLTRRLNSIVRVIADGSYVSGAETHRLDRLLDSTARLVGHPAAAVGIVLVAYGFSLFTHQTREPAPVTSAADLWQMLVSQPLFLGCLGAWLWRTVLWARLIWRISTFHLRLSPAHPDLAAGLLFVSRSVPAYIPFAVAIGTVVAVGLGRTIMIEHQPPSAQVGMLIALLAGVVAIAAGPLLPLARPIRRAQLRGILEYSTLANQLGRRFEERWLRRDVIRPDALSAPDFSATTDLYSIASNVGRIRLIPVEVRAVFALILATLLPFIPVVLIAVPTSRLLHLAASLLL